MILIAVIFPHLHQVIGAQNQCCPILVLQETSKRCRHQRFAETNDIPNEDPTTFFQMMGGDLHGGGLEPEQLVPEIVRDTKFGETRTGFLPANMKDLSAGKAGGTTTGDAPPGTAPGGANGQGRTR